MTVRMITVADPLLELGMTLGEGLVWDTRPQRLYFVDIDEQRVYTYAPSLGVVGSEVFASKITALALTESGDGEKRFNDGAVDPSGRFVAGTMGRKHSDVVGGVYSLSTFSKGYETRQALDGVTCTTGMGWSADGRTLYFTDSWIGEIATFDYDSSGYLSNRRTLSKQYGEPDGLCMDAEGGVWSARWEAGLVLPFNPEGVLTDRIELPRTWNVTCVVFGREKLNELYVTTANTGYNGAKVGERDAGGHLFVMKGLGYTGLERTRFRDQ